jgi:F-type H+-transporting ATPase subunit gamma
MSNTLENLRRKIAGAQQLESVVRTMKAQAAANIGQYETAMKALGDYYRTVELGLTVCFRQSAPVSVNERSGERANDIAAVAFGSDQGLVGQFNDRLAEYVRSQLGALPGTKTIWAVGERVCGRLTDAGFTVEKTFDVPGAITAITPLVGRILTESVTNRRQGEFSPLFIFHNRPESGTAYEPVCQQLLPLDATWQHSLAQADWPTGNLAEIIGDATAPVLRALIREYLFISLFKACAESLASENASRLSAMQRAEKNINDLLENLKQTSRTLRQSSIDEELFDVIAGYVLSTEQRNQGKKF